MHGVIPTESTEPIYLGKIGANEGPAHKEEQDKPPKVDGPLLASHRSRNASSATKLVARIKAGEFIDMSELVPDRLGVNTVPPPEGDKDEKQGQKSKRPVTNILEWVQCYSLYIHGCAYQKSAIAHSRFAWVPSPYTWS